MVSIDIESGIFQRIHLRKRSAVLALDGQDKLIGQKGRAPGGRMDPIQGKTASGAIGTGKLTTIGKRYAYFNDAIIKSVGIKKSKAVLACQGFYGLVITLGRGGNGQLLLRCKYPLVGQGNGYPID